MFKKLPPFHYHIVHLDFYRFRCGRSKKR